jgi:hypothetical protein
MADVEGLFLCSQFFVQIYILGLPTSTYLDPEMHILTLRIASRHVLKAGAVCGSSARRDLCGGWQVTAIPTATE